VSIAVDRDQAFLDGIRSIAEDVAAPHAEVVDRDARFPRQTLDALREQRALSSARAHSCARPPSRSPDRRHRRPSGSRT
jgi:alkylation response protein AidB-like acyl-CoA dehydrogenase